MSQKAISFTCRVLSVVARADHPLRTYDIARKLGARANATRVILGRLCDRGDILKLEKPGEGVFFWITHQQDTGPKIWDVFGVR